MCSFISNISKFVISLCNGLLSLDNVAGLIANLSTQGVAFPRHGSPTPIPLNANPGVCIAINLCNSL